MRPDILNHIIVCIVRMHHIVSHGREHDWSCRLGGRWQQRQGVVQIEGESRHHRDGDTIISRQLKFVIYSGQLLTNWHT